MSKFFLNSVDPDQMPHSAFRLKWAKQYRQNSERKKRLKKKKKKKKKDQ